MSDLHACIFHPRLRALKYHKVLDKVTNQWYQYGLCPMCERRLKTQDSFKQDISDRLAELAEKLKKQEEGKQCKPDMIM